MLPQKRTGSASASYKGILVIPKKSIYRLYRDGSRKLTCAVSGIGKFCTGITRPVIPDRRTCNIPPLIVHRLYSPSHLLEFRFQREGIKSRQRRILPLGCFQILREREEEGKEEMRSGGGGKGRELIGNQGAGYDKGPFQWQSREIYQTGGQFRRGGNN